jgi:hypothetical protein
MCHWNENLFFGTGTGCVIDIKIDSWGMAQAVSLKSKLTLWNWHRMCHCKENWFFGIGTGCAIGIKTDSWGMEQAVIEIKIDSLGLAQDVRLKLKLILGDWHRICDWSQNWFLGTGTGCAIETKIDSWGLAQDMRLKPKLILGDWHRICDWSQN